MTFTISAQDENGHRIPLKRAKVTMEDAMEAAWDFSESGLICDVVVTRGSKHVATYRDGNLTHYNGKEQKP
jgi:hypothetical protein